MKEISVVEMSQEEKRRLVVLDAFYEMLERNMIDESMIIAEFFSVEMENDEDESGRIN